MRFFDQNINQIGESEHVMKYFLPCVAKGASLGLFAGGLFGAISVGAEMGVRMQTVTTEQVLHAMKMGVLGDSLLGVALGAVGGGIVGLRQEGIFVFGDLHPMIQRSLLCFLLLTLILYPAVGALVGKELEGDMSPNSSSTSEFVFNAWIGGMLSYSTGFLLTAICTWCCAGIQYLRHRPSSEELDRSQNAQL